MRHGSLFSGGGGFDLAAESVGWTNVFHCEWNPFCKTILNHYWPYAHSFTDIRKFDATPFRGEIDIITGGFPCQPFSTAGKRRGTGDDRYLWPEMLRIIREVQPKWVVGENVAGLISWNGGLVFDQVHADLEAEGYQVTAVVLPAASVNAPHRRDRVWFIAHSLNHRECTPGSAVNALRKEENNIWRPQVQPEPRRQGNQGNDANTDPQRLQLAAEVGEMERRRFGMPGSGNYWADWPSQSPLCGRNDGLPSELDGITFSKWKTESIKLYGNAIVHQVAVEIFKVIMQMENLS